MEEINCFGGHSAAGHVQMHMMGAVLRHGSTEQKQAYMAPATRTCSVNVLVSVAAVGRQAGVAVAVALLDQVELRARVRVHG
jgi:hypothetical protein